MLIITKKRIERLSKASLSSSVQIIQYVNYLVCGVLFRVNRSKGSITRKKGLISLSSKSLT